MYGTSPTHIHLQELKDVLITYRLKREPHARATRSRPVCGQHSRRPTLAANEMP